MNDSIETVANGHDKPLEGQECRDCGAWKPFQDPITGKHNYGPLIGSRYSPLCTICQSAKRLETIRLKNEGGATKEWIVAELKRNYKELKRGSEKIRCLEVMAKLMSKDEATPLDDAAVIKSLMESAREKKNKARRDKRAEDRDAGPTDS